MDVTVTDIIARRMENKTLLQDELRRTRNVRVTQSEPFLYTFSLLVVIGAQSTCTTNAEVYNWPVGG